ncbi:MFS transporter [Georgfuchsia toluolica]|uniref:MFS transporter n=1 Tax=Georgfuchsia toluolica TaxID=424218 RepID=A0A916J2N0_9PROT|nr:MFS transporter [Georgfuchsia toluolica]CAG4882706.1 MFS transporter [Georgfuchsia toluolica]
MTLLPDAPSVESLRAKLGKSYAWVVLLVISGGGIASVLTSTSFTVAIPAVMREFGVGHDVVQLGMSAYVAAMTIAMLPAVWMFERFGMRRCFLASMSFMLVVSAIGSFSTSFGFMVAIRMAQGAAAGMMVPMGPIIVMRLFPPELQGRAWGVIGFAVVLAPTVAPAMGGFLVDAHGWQSIFWINIPFCIIVLIVAYFLLPLTAPRTERGPDWRGLVLLGTASLAVIVAATLLHKAGPLSWQVLSSAGLSVLAVGCFRLHARRIEHPIISLGIFRYRRVVMGAIVAFAYGVGMYGSTYLVPLFLQSVLGYSATDAGLALLPAGLVQAIMMLVGGWWVDHGSPRLICAFGLILFGAAFLALWIFASSINYHAVVIATGVSRIGLGVLLPAINLGALRGLKSSVMGQATVFLQYLRQLGGMLGVASIAVYVEWRSHQLAPAGDATLTAFAEGFLMIAIAFGISVFAASNMREDS